MHSTVCWLSSDSTCSRSAIRQPSSHRILSRCGTNICNQRCIGQVRRAHEIRNTMDKVRKVDQVTCRARNTNEMAHA